MNLNHYCSTTFGPSFKSYLIGKTAGDWVCNLRKGKGPGKSISVKDACKLQYGKTGLIAHAVTWSDPLSWRCFQRRGFRPKV